jgi:membrane protease YdiL (CAAX protease family)
MHTLLPTVWLLLVMVLGPIAGIAGGRKVRTHMPPRKLIYLANAANLILIAAITWGIDRFDGSRALQLFDTSNPWSRVSTWSILLAIGCLAFSFSVLIVRARFDCAPKRSVIRILPQTNREKIAFAGLCILIAVVEEYVFRGFVLLHLREWLASDGLAISLASLGFALMHGIQDRISIGAAFVLGVLFGIAVFATGSLIPSVIAHAAVNIFSGLGMLPVLKRLGMQGSLLEDRGNESAY